VRPSGAIRQVLDAAKEQFVVICGPTGAGKTILAVAMIRRTTGARYMFLDDLDGLSQRELACARDAALQAPALLIDDLEDLLGNEQGPPNDEAVAFLEEVLHGRVATDRPTVVTMRATQRAIERSYGIAISRWISGALRISLDPGYDWLAEREAAPDSA
jgi:hypothetical protein